MFEGVTAINGELFVNLTATNGTHIWLAARQIIAIDGKQDDPLVTRINQEPGCGSVDVQGKADDIAKLVAEAQRRNELL